MTYEAATGYDAELFTVAYSYSADMINVGEYTVTATFALKDADNYEIEGEATATAKFAITKKAVPVGATFANGTAVYTGEAMTYEAATGYNAEFFTVAYSYSADMIDVGEYTVKATFALKAEFAANYEIEGKATADAIFEITKASIDLSGIAFPAAGTNYYKGEAYDFAVENIPTGVVVDKYTYVLNDEKVDALLAVGKYTVIATFTSTNYVIPEGFKVECEFEILKTLADMNTIKLDKLTLTYNGKLQEYVVGGLPAGITATPSYTLDGLAANPVDADTYDVLIKFTSEGYTIPDDWKMKPAVLEIIPQEVTLAGVTFAGGTYTYDGNAKTYTEASGADLFNVTYGDPVGDNVNVGSFTVTATFALKDTKNYKFVGEDNTLTATYSITKQKVAVGATFDNASLEYTGEELSYENATYNDKFAVTYTYEGDRVNVGSFTVKATFALKAEFAANYEVEGEVTATATVTITPKKVKVVATLNGAEYTYNGNPHTDIVEATGYNTDLFTVVSYEIKGDNVNKGTYTVVATFAVKSDNYVIEGDPTKTADYKINPMPIVLADLELAWNVEGANKFGENYAYRTDGKTPCKMELVGGTVPLSITYVTTLLPAVSYEDEKVVEGEITEYGTYKTVATVTIESENYEIVGDTTITKEMTWGIYEENWSPVIR